MILTLGEVCVDGKANVRACGIGLGLGSIFRGEGDATLCRQNRSTGNAYIGAVPAVGGKACLGDSNTGNFRTLFHNGLGFACVVGPENDVLQRLNGAAGNSETHGLGLVAGCTHLGIGRCGRCAYHAYTTGLVGFGGGSGIADGLGLKGSVDFHASPCHCDRNHIPGGGIGNHRADGCQAQTLGQRCLGKRLCDGFGPGGKAARYRHPVFANARNRQGVPGGSGCRCLVGTGSYQRDACPGCGTGLGIGLAKVSLPEDFRANIHVALDVQLAAVGKGGILDCIQIRIDHVDRNVQAADCHGCGTAQSLCADVAQVFKADAAGNVASCRCAKGCLGGGRSDGVGYVAACTADTCHQATGKAGLCLRLSIVVIFHVDSGRFNGLCVQQGFHAALGVGPDHHDGGVIQAKGRTVVHLCLGNQPTQHLNVHIAFGPDGSVYNGRLGLGFHLRQGQGLCNAQQADVHIGTVAAAHRGRCAITRFIKPGNHADIAVGGHIRGCAFRANMGRMLCGDLGEHIVGCQFNTGNGNVGGQNLCIRCRSPLTQDD